MSITHRGIAALFGLLALGSGVAILGAGPPVKTHTTSVSDTDWELYGAHLQIDFLHKLRDEEKYADVETLKRAIANDVANTREYFAALARNTRAQNG